MTKYIPKKGEFIYKYELIEHLGGGSFGEVWLAHDHTTNKDVAVKIVSDHASSIGDQLREAQIGSLTGHANLTHVHYADVLKHEGHSIVAIVTDYHPHGSIMGKLNAAGFLPIPDAIRHVLQVLQGLEFLHHSSVYHNDIKPSNVLISDSDVAMLTDYGISCMAPKGTATQPTTVYYHHAAPETLSPGIVDVQTDIYQTGLTLYRLLNGVTRIANKINTPGQRGLDELILSGKLVTSDDYFKFIPGSLKRVINKAVNVDRSKRYPSALEMRRALEKLSYPGFWSVNPEKQWVGSNGNYEYQFNIAATSASTFSLEAWRISKSSTRRTHVSKFCGGNLPSQRSDKMLHEFMLWVVEDGR